LRVVKGFGEYSMIIVSSFFGSGHLEHCGKIKVAPDAKVNAGSGEWQDYCTSTKANTYTNSFISGSIENLGEIRMGNFTYSGGSVTGNPFIYTGGTLQLNNPIGTVIDPNSIFWPSTNGPTSVLSRGPLTMNVTRTLRELNCYPTSPLTLNAPLTVTFFHTSAHVTNAHNLTVVGSFNIGYVPMVIDSGGSFDSSPTYVGNVTLDYRGRGSHDVGPEWGSGTSVGVGVPLNVVIRGTVNMPSGPRRCPESLYIDPNGTLRLAATPGASLSVGGDWTNQGVFIHNSREVIFDGDLTLPYPYRQQINGSTTFANLTINNPLGILITDTIRVDQTLKFITGNLRVYGFSNLGTLILSGDVIGASSARHIVTERATDTGWGRVVRTIAANDGFQFPIGGSDTTYNPVTIALAPGDPAETFSVYVQDYLSPEPPIYPYQALEREWNIVEKTEGGNNATLKFYWNASDPASSGFDPASGIAIGRHNGSWWTNTTATYNAGPPTVLLHPFLLPLGRLPSAIQARLVTEQEQ